MPSERIKTGIAGLDTIIEGGLPRGFSYLVMGGPGAGKTIFGCQFLYKGATVYGENGVYVTFDEPPYSIANNMLRFNWNLYGLENKGQMAFVDASPIRGDFPGRYLVKGVLGTEKFELQSVVSLINDARREVNARRCVIDSISALTLQCRDEFEKRQMLLTLMKALSEMGLTSILISEVADERRDRLIFDPIAFLAQGVIILHMFRIEDSLVRALEIRKMRGVKQHEKLCLYKITEEGIEVYPEETVFGIR